VIFRELAKGVSLLLGLPKTVAFNFRYLPFAQAWRLPVLLSPRVKLVKLGGHVTVDGRRFGCVHLGVAEVDVFPDATTIWRVEGHVRLGEGVRIGPGSKIVCTGELDIGAGVLTNARVTIFCAKQVVIGRDTLISWDVTIVDNDFHELKDVSGECINPPAPIVIGERGWIGFNAIVAKDTKLAAGTVIGAGAVVRGTFEQPDSVLTGNPARLARRGVQRGTEL
jgi:acetyltransferase-like isoleucine patch superfamily enzyme